MERFPPSLSKTDNKHVEAFYFVENLDKNSRF